MTQTSKESAACCRQLDRLLSPEFFKALGDSRRQSILFTLATAGGTWTVSRVAEAVPIDVSVVSRHLAQLRDAGILAAERVGKEVHYSVRYDALVSILRQLADAIEGCCPPESNACCPPAGEQGE